MRKLIISVGTLFSVFMSNVSAAGIDIGITHTDGYEIAYNFLDTVDEGLYLQHSAVYERSESSRGGYEGSVAMNGISYKLSVGAAVSKHAAVYGIGKIGYVHSSGEQTYVPTNKEYTGSNGLSLEFGAGIRGEIVDHFGYYFEVVYGSRAYDENKLQGFPQDEGLKGTLGAIFVF